MLLCSCHAVVSWFLPDGSDVERKPKWWGGNGMAVFCFFFSVFQITVSKNCPWYEQRETCPKHLGSSKRETIGQERRPHFWHNTDSTCFPARENSAKINGFDASRIQG